MGPILGLAAWSVLGSVLRSVPGWVRKSVLGLVAKVPLCTGVHRSSALCGEAAGKQSQLAIAAAVCKREAWVAMTFENGWAGSKPAIVARQRGTPSSGREPATRVC